MSDYKPLDLKLEPLETRRLLAGLVEITTNAAGDVILNGDNLDNDIRLVLDRVGDQSYLVVEGEAGTQIRFDGITNDFRIVPITTTDADNFRIDRDLRIQMRGGNDDVEILAWLPGELLEIGRDLNVNMGTGGDSFYVEGLDGPASTVDRNLIVNAVGGNAADYLDVNRMLAKRIELRLGAAGTGIDQAVLRDSFAEVVRMNGTAGETELSVQRTQALDARLTTGTGEDQILLSATLFTELYINAGSAPNSAVVGDYILFGSSQTEDLTIIGTGGQTTVNFDATVMGSGSVLHGDVLINTGAGGDLVRVTNAELTVFLGEVTINTAGGSDRVEIAGKNFFGLDVDVNLGGGSDELAFEYDPVVDTIAGTPAPPTFVSELTVRGGGGFDTIVDLGLADLWEPLHDISIEHFG